MKKLIIILAFILLMSASACEASHIAQPTIVSDTTFALDTVIQIKIYYADDRDNDEDIIGDAFDVIRQLENTLSVHMDGSELHSIKQNAGIKPVVVSDITYSIITDSIAYSKMTDGLFDVTAGPLIDLWGIDPPDGYVPTDVELNDALELIDYKSINFLGDNEIFLQDEGMIINLGAIAKGAIADETKAYLLEQGIESCFINLGGNVLLIGSKPGDIDFSIGIQNPFDDRGAYIMALAVSDVAVVSSGDYERFFVKDGIEYHHILDTQTGHPARTNIKQVSIIAPTSQMADALSTSVLLLGIEDGLKLVESMDGVEAIFITKDKKVYVTEALRGSITTDEEQMADFELVDDAGELYGE